MIFFVGGDAIDDAVSADIFGILIQNRHAGLDTRPDDQRIDSEKFLPKLLRGRQHRWHDARDRDRGNLLTAMAGVIDQLRDDDAVFVGGSFRLSGETPVGD